MGYLTIDAGHYQHAGAIYRSAGDPFLREDECRSSSDSN